VGKFSIAAIVQKNKIATDESATLKVTIKGTGNLPMINAPEIRWPQGIEAFEPVSAEAINKQAVPLSGQKTFTFPFTADKQGNYQIAGVQFTFFDVTSQTFKTLVTSPIIINVKKGNAIKKIIKPFIKKPDQASVFSNPNFWILVSSIIIAGLAIIFVKRKKDSTDIKSPSKEQTIYNKTALATNTPIAKHPLLDAEAVLKDNDPQRFYYILNACLRQYLGKKFNVPPNELSKKRITQLLDKNNASVNTVVLLTSVLEETELNLYAPASTANEMQQTYAKASEVVALLDKQVISSR
jgi:hypothetical protein